MNKKGQVFEQFGSLAIGIAALAILLVVAFLIMDQGKEQAVDLTGTTRFNETISSVTFEVFTAFPKCVAKFSTMSVAEVLNHTNASASPVSTAMYTVGSYYRVNFTNKSGAFGMNSFNVTYVCKEPDHAYNATGELQRATDTVPTWVPIIVITFIGAILLGLVALIRKKREL